MARNATKPVKRIIFEISDPVLMEEIESISMYHGTSFVRASTERFVALVRSYPVEMREFKNRQEELDNRAPKMSVKG